MTDWFDDREALAEQYADAANLSDRVALHERFSTAEVDLHPWLFDRLDLPSDARVLTLGGGPGDLWAAVPDRVPEGWSVLHTDASPGMVEEARETLRDANGGFGFGVVDAASLPFASNSFDAVTANHMLYHVAERRRALREVRRVLRPGGRLYATTNGERALKEVYEVAEGVHGGPLARIDGFRLENGREQLADVFESVTLHRHDNALAVTEVEPVVRYLCSREEFGPEDAPDLHAAFVDRFEDGVLHVEKDTGVLVARKEGGR
ncbi:class I SAM-dependent methyltransferase [Halomarina litorea]|uniref:class I SAM-dependent methyltransferase n=1 Tax=Halomarina litorea TaxID=2961595 RepID=UPI0020C53B45|nr:methyltransferase domain-containing protein [Halomarina sp. BCD28]